MSPTMTTAQAREAARAAERRLDLAEAARLWTLAADLYPTHRSRMGALGAKDVDNMRQRAATCLRSTT